MNLLKTSIEDVAFNMWNGEVDNIKDFVIIFFNKYPGFESYYSTGELEKALSERL